MTPCDNILHILVAYSLRLEFNSKSLFWCQSRNFRGTSDWTAPSRISADTMPPFWPRYHSDGLSPVRVRFDFFSKQICNVEALICHFYKNIKALTQIHFPRDHIFRTCTIFYRHYKGLHQMRKDLVLCALWRDFLIFFSLFLESLVKTKKKCHFLLTCVVPKWQNKPLLSWRCSQKSAYFGSFKHLRNTMTLLPICWYFLNFKMTKNSFIWKKKK